MGLVRYHSSAVTLFAAPVLMTSVGFAQSTGSFPELPSQAAPQPAAQPYPDPAPPAASAAPTPATPPIQYPPPPQYPQQSTPPQRPSEFAAPASAALPPTLPYREGQPIPSGYRLESETNTGLMIGGALTLAAGYGAALIFAASNSFENGSSWTLAPVIGPYGAIGARKFRCNKQALQNTDCFDKAVDEVESITFLAVDGLVQAVGLTLLIVGAADRKSFLVREDLTLTLVPRSFSNGFGLGFHANF